jgi:hypothetical protein
LWVPIKITFEAGGGGVVSVAVSVAVGSGLEVSAAGSLVIVSVM